MGPSNQNLAKLEYMGLNCSFPLPSLSWGCRGEVRESTAATGFCFQLWKLVLVMKEGVHMSRGPTEMRVMLLATR